ncbi:MAG TPA: alpha/beta fold hydrolase [Gemmatimonadaceae bacterium]|jgi:pimeloyl-ACP methyl ester carboxylesterase|nr:alpha/beta fold hydrolase [Gemmatimonadaceae bacterium]
MEAVAQAEISTNVRARTGASLASLRLAMYALSRVSPPLARTAAVRLFCTPLARHRARSEELGILPSAVGGSVSIDGNRVRFWRWGSGPAVLLVHGWGGSGAQLTSFIGPLVARGYSAVTFDAPAHGDSDGSTSNLLQFAAAVEQLASRVGTPRATIAHSLGGTAVAYAAGRGVPVGRVALISAAANPLVYFRAFLDLLGVPSAHRPRYERHVEEKLGFRWHEVAVPDFAPYMSMPMLAVHDLDDRDVSWRESAAIAEAWPNARLVTTSGLGHNRILRDEGVVRQVVDFVTR